MSFRLGLEHADGLAADIEQVIDLAGEHRELADRDPESRRDVHLALVLNHPAALSKLAVDVLPGSVFRVHRRSREPPRPGSRFRRETMGSEMHTIRSQRRLHHTPRIRSVLPCTVFSWATARERALRLTGIRPACLEPAAMSASGHARMVNDRPVASVEKRIDLSEEIAWSGNILNFGDILNMDGPFVEIGPLSVFANLVVGRWQ